jgi:transcriptional regulator
MYVPSVHRIQDQSVILRFMQENPFAILTSVVEGIPVATHLPILVESTDPIVLCGHMARQNRQWKVFASGAESLLIYAGPHGYVSPRLYASTPNVPTWNYITVHAYGTVEIIDDEEQALAHLQRIVSTFDPSLSEVQPESTEPQFYKSKLPGIVAFRFTVSRIDAKAKLNQNKPEADRLAVRESYLVSEVSDEQAMGSWMKDGSS